MFDHYVAVDWALDNMAIARITKKTNKIKVIDVPSNVVELQTYLKNLKGDVCLTFEETTCAQWLYSELNDCVSKLIVCDPHRNKLLSDGAKNDKIDAKKLAQLLKANLLKEVYHTNDEYIYIRKLVSGYEDNINSIVRAKNQRSALFRAYNMDHKKEKDLAGYADSFVLEGLDRCIKINEVEIKRYQKEFDKLKTKHPEIKNIMSIPGIGIINAVKAFSRVINAHRFPKRNHFLVYCGLIKYEMKSGGRIYGKRLPRHCKMLKMVFKTAALSAISGDTPFSRYYRYLINEKGYTEWNARHAVARKIATVVYGILKTGKKYDIKNFIKKDIDTDL